MERLPPVAIPLDESESPVQRDAAQPSLARDCNFFHLLANSTTALKAFLAYENALAGGRLSRQQRVIIALTVAEINGSKYGLSAHYGAAKEAGLSDDEIQQARKATSSDPKNAALLRFARAVALQRGDISDADFQPLRQVGFSDKEIPEIVANIAFNIFMDYFNNVVRTAVDFPLLQPGSDAPITPPLTRVPRELAI
ncbi:MAG TPA: carboxymuconolactone decarboxylase family protein [Candidatus Paceibacterota bacterium]|nr:carboxymuconolactone decarboxylase family protein [Verrucomicrobiota bacterium]HRY46561.1 carboxymuconolactone decarboxylase family protein [Candidatus Paceibacterota bacterium]HSA01364.1 carboxymuconolactone decarboxylase family protein [Candidatus Paceibacterota bacterium]